MILRQNKQLLCLFILPTSCEIYCDVVSEANIAMPLDLKYH